MALITMEAISELQGAELEETVLWTNPSPTSASGIYGNVTLSDDINNYDFIAIDFIQNYTAAGQVINAKTYCKVSELKNYKSYVGNGWTGVGGFCYNSQNAIAYRQFWYASDTQIAFGYGYIGSTAYATWVVPMHIYGCKIVPAKPVKSKFLRDVNAKTSAQTFHTRNAMFTCGYVSTGTTQAKYLQGMLIDGTLNVWYNYQNNYTVTFDPSTNILSIQLTGTGLNETEGANLQIMYEDLG